jgi:hypothetical protein
MLFFIEVNSMNFTYVIKRSRPFLIILSLLVFLVHHPLIADEPLIETPTTENLKIVSQIKNKNDLIKFLMEKNNLAIKNADPVMEAKHNSENLLRLQNNALESKISSEDYQGLVDVIKKIANDRNSRWNLLSIKKTRKHIKGSSNCKNYDNEYNFYSDCDPRFSFEIESKKVESVDFDFPEMFAGVISERKILNPSYLINPNFVWVYGWKQSGECGTTTDTWYIFEKHKKNEWKPAIIYKIFDVPGCI